MTNKFHDLITRMAKELDDYRQLLLDDRTVTHRLSDEARAVLADEPAVPEVVGSEWQPCVKLPITVHVREQRPGEQHVSTREGITPVQPDDLIMLGVDGEEYPIGRELFQRTYRMGSADEPAVPEGREPAAVTGQSRPTEDDAEDAAQCIYEAMRFERVETTPAWSELGNSLAQDTARKAARAVLAHWGNPAPAPPADGEVAELVEWLQEEADDYECRMMTDFLALCAELADAYLRTLEHINNSTWLGYEPSDDPLLQRARASLAELAAWLQDSAAKCRRAAELLQRQAPVQPADGEVAGLVADLQQQANHGFSDLTRNLLINLASHMAYMQGQLQARHDPDEDDLEDCYWYAESVALRQMVSDALAGKPAALLPLADTHYEWELEDAKGEWQAGGSSNSQSDVEREGMRYLQTYTQDGPHKLIIRQHTTQTINEITNG